MSLNRDHAPSWPNNLTVWRLPARGELELASYVQREYTINHAIMDAGKLVICAWDHVEVCSPDGAVASQFSHSWLAGGHTIFADRIGNYVVSCSSSDAVLTFSRATGTLVSAWRPAGFRYGHNYKLALTDDIRQHYIPNDFQISHVNCAYPTGAGVLATLFIQGAVVWLAKGSRQPREILSGYIGCHGGRTASCGQTIYFADSPRGQVVWCDWHGRVVRTADLHTKWLHDVQQLREQLYLCTVGDTNELLLLDAATGHIVWRKGLSEFGETPLLLATGECHEAMT